MTTEQNDINFGKLIASLNFHIHNTLLREKLVAFVTKNEMLLKSTPASSQHHHAENGGLLRHLVELNQLGIEFLQTMHRFVGAPYTKQVEEQQCEDLVISVLLHDLHKMTDPFGRKFYELNILKSGKQSEAKPYERNSKCFDLAIHLRALGTAALSSGVANAAALLSAVGEFADRNRERIQEGELSLLLLNVVEPSIYALLNDSVKYAVRNHDGAYVTSGFSLAGKETPVMLALHHADMVSSRADRWRKPSAE